MNIGLFVGDHYSINAGGAEVQIKYLYEEWIKKGHNIIYFYFDKKGFSKRIINTNLKLISIPKPYKGIKLFNYLKKNKIIKIIKSEKLDILYQRGNYDFGDIVVKYGNKNKIPVITGISSLRHTKKKIVDNKLFFIIYLIENLIIKEILDYSDLIICQTKDEAISLRNNYHHSSIIIPNGIPIPEIIKDKKKYVIWIGNIKQLKQPEKYIELAKRFKEKRIKFLMIGKPIKDKYQNKINQMLLKNKNVKYLKQKSLDEVNNYINKSIVLINTSMKDSEGFPNTYLQAWSREIPVISLHCDLDNLIKNKKIGFISNNIDNMENDLNKILYHNDLRIKMGTIGRKYCINNFNIIDIANEYDKIFYLYVKRWRIKK